MLGVPLMFVIAAAMVAAGHVAAGTVLGIALVPAVFIGPYLGGFVLLGRASARHEPHGSSS